MRCGAEMPPLPLASDDAAYPALGCFGSAEAMEGGTIADVTFGPDADAAAPTVVGRPPVLSMVARSISAARYPPHMCGMVRISDWSAKLLLRVIPKAPEN